MAIYNKQSIQLLCDLINASNPALVPPVSPAIIRFSLPSVVVPVAPAIQNTKLTLFGIAAGPYIGKTDVTYRRIDLSKLMRGMTVQINRYSVNGASASSGAVVFSIYNLLPHINAKYGLSLTTDDVTDGNITRGTTLEGGFYTNTIVVTTKATSMGFIGSFTLKWKQAAQDISTMISVVTLAGRAFPGGNVFDGSHRPVVNTASYGVDVTDVSLATPWLGYPNSINSVSSHATTVAWFNACIAEINLRTGTTLPTGTVNDTAQFPAASITLVTLPSALYPEANSKYFNRALIFDMVNATQIAKWGVGRFIFHLNM